ncbi:ADP-ribosylation factor protein 3 [Thelotrema lepadinum]|nr:ADP-ribosylation factor protein 3 [Thelotrema lepadinum]
MTRNIGLVDQHLKSLIVRAWTRQISEGRLLDNGWTRLHAPTTVRNVIASIFCRLFFGDELAQHDQFVSAATGFATDVVATAEVLKYTPEFMKTIAARVLTRGYKNQEYLHQRLISIVEGLMTKHKDSNLDKKQNDTETIMQLIARSAKGKKAFDPDKIVSVILCLWLGSIHQPVMGSIQLLYDLCRYPEYLDALQKEALANPEGLQNLDLNADMPLLDSFLRESNRVRPGEAISLRRKVLAPVALPSGNQLQEGDAVVVSQYTIMQDEKNYANAHLFQGFRFATGHPEQTQTSRFADPDDSYHLWGAGKHVW